jgi:hypothetical protein
MDSLAWYGTPVIKKQDGHIGVTTNTAVSIEKAVENKRHRCIL